MIRPFAFAAKSATPLNLLFACTAFHSSDPTVIETTFAPFNQCSIDPPRTTIRDSFHSPGGFNRFAAASAATRSYNAADCRCGPTFASGCFSSSST